jgi:hypothetical protein
MAPAADRGEDFRDGFRQEVIVIRFFVSLFLMFATLVGAVLWEGGSVLAYVVASAFAVELLVPAFAMLAVWRLSEIGAGFRDAFSAKGGSSTVARSKRIWEFAEKICYATAVVGLIIGMVILFSTYTGSEAHIGPALAACCLGPLYGVLLGIVCRILRARVDR